jgi:hypothetical protein
VQQQQQSSMPTQSYQTYVPKPYIPRRPREQQSFQPSNSNPDQA